MWVSGIAGVAVGGAAVAADVVGTGGGDATGVLTQFGLAGAIGGLLVAFARTAYKRETDRADRLEQQVFALHEATASKVFPVLEEASRSMSDMARASQESTIAIRDLQAQRELERRLREREGGDR